MAATSTPTMLKPRTHECVYCGKRITSQANLNRHVEAKHNGYSLPADAPKVHRRVLPPLRAGDHKHTTQHVFAAGDARLVRRPEAHDMVEHLLQPMDDRQGTIGRLAVHTTVNPDQMRGEVYKEVAVRLDSLNCEKCCVFMYFLAPQARTLAAALMAAADAIDASARVTKAALAK